MARGPRPTAAAIALVSIVLIALFWSVVPVDPAAAQPPQSTPDTSTPDTSIPDTSTPEPSNQEPAIPKTLNPETLTPKSSTQDTSTPVLTSEAERIQIISVDHTPELVTLDIVVPPSIGRLTPVAENFGLTDGGRLVDVTVSSLGASADVVLAIDTSGSMRGSALASATAAAAEFIGSLPDGVRVGLVSFGESVTTHQRPTRDRAAVLADLVELTADGEETVLWDALMVAAEIAGEAEVGASSVVVLSDGDDTASGAEPSQVVEAFNAGSAVLYTVAIESPDTNLDALEQTTIELDGQFFATTDIGQLDALYNEIGGRLSGRYRLRFVPVGEGTRTVVVSVAAGSGLAVASTELTGTSLPAETSSTTTGQSPAPVLNVDEHQVLGTAVPVTPGLASGLFLLALGLLCMFGAMLIGGLTVARPAAKVRLNAASSSDRLKGANVRLGLAVDRVITDHDQGRRFDARLEAADINLRPGEFLLAWLLTTAVAALSALAAFGLIYSVVIVVVSALMTLVFLNTRTRRRRASFADQLSETLGIMASSLRSGQSLPRSIELVAAEAPSPTAEEFHRISFEVRVGRDLTESIMEAASRMDSPDLEWLAQAVDINRELGGDLTEILDNVAGTIRERRTVARQINALSSEGRATGWVLLGLPVALFLFSWWRTPNSIEALFTEPIGRILVAIALTGMTVGHIWIRRLVRLKF